MAGFPRSDIDADYWQTVTPNDWSFLDHIKAYGLDAKEALGNLGTNLLGSVSPFHPDAAKAGAPSYQVPPMIQGIADSYSRLAGTPSRPGKAARSGLRSGAWLKPNGRLKLPTRRLHSSR